MGEGLLLALCLCDEACGFYSANSQIQYQIEGGGRGMPGEVIEEQLSKFLICEKKHEMKKKHTKYKMQSGRDEKGDGGKGKSWGKSLRNK